MSGPEYTSLPAADLDNISGNIFVPNTEEDDTTLDEPISATLVREYVGSPSEMYRLDKMTGFRFLLLG